MRKPQGHIFITSPEHPEQVFDTFTCGHCQRIVEVKPYADPADMGGLCRVCDSYICNDCCNQNTCSPWEKQMEIMENRQNFFRDFAAVK